MLALLLFLRKYNDMRVTKQMNFCIEFFDAYLHIMRVLQIKY